MRVLVTGGTGYIGSTAVDILLEQGYEISILDDCSTGHADTAPAGMSFIQGSLLNSGDLAQALVGVDAVMHFAGKSLVGESVEKPDLYHQVNVDGTRNLLDEMHKSGVKKLVFSSSAATYGEPKQVPILESAPTKPTNPYGATKLAIDQMITAESAARGIAAASLRYFNVAGALKSKRGWLAERHNPETHLIPVMFENLNNFVINGKDYRTPDGTCIRDYVHVSDVADAHVAAADYMQTRMANQPTLFNLGTGKGYSVLEVIQTAVKELKIPINYTFGEKREGDPPRLVAIIDLAKKHLKFKPKHDLKSILRTAYAWHEKN